MVDVLTKKQRSFNMSRIRGKDTKPEMVVRKLIHSLGYRYRLHQKNLPGQPDIVLTRHHKIILVNGCFWHMHKCRYGKVKPKTNPKFWQTKRMGNVERGRKNLRQLRKVGWKVLIVWECQVKDTKKLTQMLQKFFS